MTSKGIGNRAIRGSIWLSGATLAARILGALRLVALAAILPQHELGLFGISLIVMRLVDQLSETGMRQALIQNASDIEEYIDTAWFAQIIRGSFVGILLWCFADVAENFFEKPGIAPLLRWLAILPVAQGFLNIGFVHLNRELAFGKIVIHSTSVSLTEILLSILLGFLHPFAISLVFAKIISIFFAVCLSFKIENRRANLGFSITKFRELYSFGFWIFISSILSFTMVNGGDLVIGKMLTSESLAIYQVSYSLACVPLMQMMSVASTTMYSALSRLQNDLPRLRSAFLKLFFLTCVVSVYSVIGFFLLGPTLTETILPSDYNAVSALLPVLSIWGASRAMGSINSALFQASGRPALATIFQFLMVAIFFLVAVPLVARFGLQGMAWSLVLAGVISHIGRILFLARILKVKISSLTIRITVPCLAGALSYSATSRILSVMQLDLDYLTLLIGILAVSLIYGSVVLAAEIFFEFGLLLFAAQNSQLIQRCLGYFRIYPVERAR